MPPSHTASSFDALGHGKPSQNSDDSSGHCGLLDILILALGWLTIELFHFVRTRDQLHFRRATPIALLHLSLLRLVLDAAHISLLSLHPCFKSSRWPCTFSVLQGLCHCSGCAVPRLFPWSLVSLPPRGVLASPLLWILVSPTSCRHYLVSTPVLFTPLRCPQTVNFINILSCLSLLFPLSGRTPCSWEYPGTWTQVTSGPGAEGKNN